MPQTQRISKNNTVIMHNENKTIVVLHSTPVVTIDHKARTVLYNHGGWVTATTVTRMNQVSNQFSLPYRVGRSKGIMTARNWKTDEVYEFNGYGKCLLPLEKE